MSELPRVVVTAAVVEEGGAFLVTRRLTGTHLEGFWEFPGGKCEPGESYGASLRREMLEELGASVEIGRELLTVAHPYRDRIVELHFFECSLDGTPRPLLGQEMRWVRREDLPALEFPPADEDLIRLLVERSSA